MSSYDTAYEITNEMKTALLSWYEANKRDLPWRETGDPYHVWLSEIMLQQTRVEAVREKFIEFTSELPDIPSLAGCDDDRLMRLWEGMGYYSRARNLKKCAQALMNEYQGRLPEERDELIRLPGIGPYTAGAVSAIAYGRPAAAVDGNVMRVLARLFGMEDDIRDAHTKQLMEQIILHCYDTWTPDRHTVQSFTQAWMEIGALVCVPNGPPHCSECPFVHVCRAHLEETTNRIPYRSPLKQRKIIEKTILVIRDGEHFLLHKRPDTGLLAGLYEFPSVDAVLSVREALDETERLGFEPLHIRRLPDSRHIFTHLEWHMTAYEIRTASPLACSEGYILADKKDLAQRAIPNAFQKYKDYYQLRD